MKIEIIRNNNYTLSPHGRCDFLIATFHGRCDFLIATLAGHIKNSIFDHRITLNIIRKKYPNTEKKQNVQCHKIQEKSRKMLEFRTKNRYKPRLLLEFTRVTNLSQTCHKPVTNLSQMCHKQVTNQSQMCHKSVTNTSQKWQFWTKVVTFRQEELPLNQ